MFTWFEQHEAWAWWLAAASAAMFVGTLVAMPLIVARIPADHFTRSPREPQTHAHPAWRLTWLIVKNVLGVVLLVAGVAMLVLPGQGLLTILVGLMLLNFPGKRRLERWLIRHKHIRRAVGWIRARRGAEPLQLP